MHVIHSLSFADIRHSGTAHVVPMLCESLIGTGAKVTLVVLEWDSKVYSKPYIKRFALGWGPKSLGRSPEMAKFLLHQAKSKKVQIIDNHGLWMMPNVYPGWARKHGECRLVVSPHGTLSQWALAHHAWRKKVFWWLFQAQTLRRADAFHATSEQEYLDVRRLGFRQPVCVVPNGVDIPPAFARPERMRKSLLYLGRIHKIKGIDNLLRAWAMLEPCFAEWDLVIAGPDSDGYLSGYQDLARQLELTRVSFVGPLYGDDKLQAYREASVYVLPTHSENFGITVAEALAAGTPAIVTKGAPWQGLVEHDAGWWIDIGVEPLVAALKEALAMPEERLRRMGQNGREWMERDFSWRTIALQMIEFYQWLLGYNQRPEFVRLD